ncbi:NDP-hexose 2,3-dehydratase [Schinkia azotoformans MEV2011]|uniref:NDP-hexose 2,3-dehydratase n=1 Tax=Schinkia azotoformans MEV2011 TaxID=1348973 RepID=A0A072NN32_SCHAZ|nr:NDP-hexose 2,3-dehydratase family protein [Schinkia azotoformans]KEF38881.1 NDP-hexose 2,3-dehydratase [Schinkia azotoformans MEV2011]MEC1696785.1 NDP-hexose 2,3-dehydratase family protein [Schinkia azotoformans]MEC1725006.1 NDP-hexose 2,3-dehydratase family protein [Schinkia azotoformans]MEC1741759.1 NDP-hexose 2,3-dehydratase family protein [Schinkia azotoformans]MEC1766563.1 NDP-hexose 2,3-dehydratase family protein [Schinkia azotoformans]
MQSIYYFTQSIYSEFMTTWLTKDGIHSSDELLKWINDQNKNLKVKIKKIPLEQSDFWYYDRQSGVIKNKNDSFFSISGIQQLRKEKIITEQPIIIQDEIGFLGIICKRINGIIHFLMQAKIEPGNINKVQISPTIQSTKSNFMQKHGGRCPAFLEYFIEAKPNEIIVDQIQSEQSSRFYKKRNRNVILLLDNEIAEPPTHKWMTLGQIKHLMRFDNLVNMDTRTVLSCIPFSLMDSDEMQLAEIENKCQDRSLLRSMYGNASMFTLKDIYHTINNYKMFNETQIRLVDLFTLKNWYMETDKFVCKEPYPFTLIFCDISIEGREVVNWTQPLFEAQGMAIFGLLCCEDNGIKKFLVKAKPEIGCYDGIELGPTVQHEVTEKHDEDIISTLFFDKLTSEKGIMVNVLLSEEGGRFYHEQNRNVIIEIQKDEIQADLPNGYFWCDFKTLNFLTQVNNCLNIQLRNLLSLLEV